MFNVDKFADTDREIVITNVFDAIMADGVSIMGNSNQTSTFD